MNIAAASECLASTGIEDLTWPIASAILLIIVGAAAYFVARKHLVKGVGVSAIALLLFGALSLAGPTPTAQAAPIPSPTATASTDCSSLTVVFQGQWILPVGAYIADPTQVATPTPSPSATDAPVSFDIAAGYYDATSAFQICEADTSNCVTLEELATPGTTKHLVLSGPNKKLTITTTVGTSLGATLSTQSFAWSGTGSAADAAGASLIPPILTPLDATTQATFGNGDVIYMTIDALYV